MPVIVVGADTRLGAAIVDLLLERGGEVRAFVSDPDAAGALKSRGVKVALGDVSDRSHLGPAAYHAFTAVLVEAATRDGRSFSFADDAEGILVGWAAAIRQAGVKRAIWVGDPPESIIGAFAGEVAVVTPEARTAYEVAAEVADLNDRRALSDQ